MSIETSVLPCVIDGRKPCTKECSNFGRNFEVLTQLAEEEGISLQQLLINYHALIYAHPEFTLEKFLTLNNPELAEGCLHKNNAPNIDNKPNNLQ